MRRSTKKAITFKLYQPLAELTGTFFLTLAALIPLPITPYELARLSNPACMLKSRS